MKTNLLYVMALTLGGCMALASCDEALEEGSFPTDYASVAHFVGTEDEPETPLTLLRTGEDVKYSLVMGRGGNDLNAGGSAELKVMTEEELAAYNTEKSSDYVLLPADFYTLSKTELTFLPGASRDTVTVTFKADYLDDIQQASYVLPFYLNGTGGTTVHEGLDRCILILSVDVPTITLEIPDIQTVEKTTYDADRTASLPLTGYIDLSENKWAFEATFESDRTVLQQYVDEYNSTNSVNYTLLPTEMYTLPSFSFAAGQVLVTGTLNVDVTSVDEESHYLLPVVLKECVGQPFDVDKTIRYVHVYVKDQLPEIELTETMLEGSFPYETSDPYSCVYSNMWDDDASTFWESSWSVGASRKDPKYGVWLDISLSTPISVLAFEYQTQDRFIVCNPKIISIYAYNDEVISSDAQAIKTITLDDSYSPAGVWYSSENLQLGGTFGKIRIAIEEIFERRFAVVGGDVGWAGIAELRIYGQ